MAVFKNVLVTAARRIKDPWIFHLRPIARFFFCTDPSQHDTDQPKLIPQSNNSTGTDPFLRFSEIRPEESLLHTSGAQLCSSERWAWNLSKGNDIVNFCSGHTQNLNGRKFLSVLFWQVCDGK